MIQIADYDPAWPAPFAEPLQELGFVFRRDNPELTKRYFREPPGTPRTHVHVRRLGSFSQQFALLFRDYLREHPAAARAYAAEKRRLADEFRDDRHGYTDAKDPFIWRTIQQADRWAQRVGWREGPSDA
ncbi:GrpB family protein [Paractinoplanes lichenicola]|uniref:GrpB family protein n=1 Tax=Paractinoplanes lichenicola TaxID=2802976 RepID=UPI0027DAC059|nr:GrpB family protein [Actinoplanes lichenicola]